MHSQLWSLFGGETVFHHLGVFASHCLPVCLLPGLLILPTYFQLFLHPFSPSLQVFFLFSSISFTSIPFNSSLVEVEVSWTSLITISLFSSFWASQAHFFTRLQSFISWNCLLLLINHFTWQLILPPYSILIRGVLNPALTSPIWEIELLDEFQGRITRMLRDRRISHLKADRENWKHFPYRKETSGLWVSDGMVQRKQSDFSQQCPVTEEEVMGTDRDVGSDTWTSENAVWL